MISQNPEHSPYYQSDIRDAIRTRKWLRGEDMSNGPKWIVKDKNIPCAWYAISVLAPENGIKCLHRHAVKSKYDGYWHAIAIVKKGDGKFASTRTAHPLFTMRKWFCVSLAGTPSNGYYPKHPQPSAWHTATRKTMHLRDTLDHQHAACSTRSRRHTTTRKD